MTVDYITHDEAMIQHFIDDPEFADLYLSTVIADGNDEEIAEVKAWYNEAKARTQKLGYWESLVDNAEKAAQEGKNLDVVIALMNRALGILKAAVPAVQKKSVKST